MSQSFECEPGSGSLNVLQLRCVGDLQWRRCSMHGSSSLPRDDPLLSSWNRLLDAGLAACFDEWSPNGRTASARQAGHAEPLASPDTSRRRQLWVFWHCSETPDWERLISSDLEEVESGCWKEGVSERCLQAMLAAFHCRLEKTLADQNFVCLGRWFLKPFDVFQPEGVQRARSTSLSVARESVLFSFSLFVAGGRWLCAAVDVKRCRSLQPLNDQRFQQLESLPEGLRVLLCPSGLGATLRYQVSSKQPGKEQSSCLEDWKAFYPILTTRSIAGVPAVVEVEIQGVRMLHPSVFVLVQSKIRTGQQAVGASLGMVGHQRQDFIAKLMGGLGSFDTTAAITQLSHLCWESAVTVSGGKRDTTQGMSTKPFVNSVTRQQCGCNSNSNRSTQQPRSSQATSRLRERRLQRQHSRFVPFHQLRSYRSEPVKDMTTTQPDVTIVTSILRHPVTVQGIPGGSEHGMCTTSRHPSPISRVSVPRSVSSRFESRLPSPFLGERRPTSVNPANRSPSSQTGGPGAQRTFLFDSSAISRVRMSGTLLGRSADVKQTGKHGGESVYRIEDYESLKASLMSEEVGPYVGPVIRRKTMWGCYELPEDGTSTISLERNSDMTTTGSEPNENMSDEVSQTTRKRPASVSAADRLAKQMHIDLTGEDIMCGITPDDRDVFTPGGEEPILAPTLPEKRGRKPSGRRGRSRAGSRRKSRSASTKKEAPTPVTTFPLRHDAVKVIADVKSFVSVSPLSPQPSPPCDVFQDDGQIGPTTGPRPAIKSRSSFDWFDEKALEPSADDYMFNLLEGDDDGGGTEEPKLGGCGDASQSSGMTGGSSNIPHMKQNKVDWSRIYPTPPSTDQTSPGTTADDSTSATKVSQERKAAIGQANCLQDEAMPDEILSPVEMISLSEELLVSSMYDRIELPSEQRKLQFPLKDHSHLVYTSTSTCTAEDDGPAVRFDMPFTTDGTSMLVSITTHSPFTDMSRPSVTTAAMMPRTGMTVARIRRTSQLNSSGSPCPYHSPCYTPIHPPGDSGMTAVFSQPTGNTNGTIRPAGLPTSHSLLVNLLCHAHAQLHLENDSTTTVSDEIQSSVPLSDWSKLGTMHGISERWTNRQASMGFDVTDFSAMQVQRPVDEKINSFIGLIQRHCLASLCFRSGWGCLNGSKLSSSMQQSLKQVTNPVLLEKWIQHGSDLCDGRPVPMGSVSTTALTTVQDAADALALSHLRDVDSIQRELEDMHCCLEGYSNAEEKQEPLLTIAKFQDVVDPDGLSHLETLSVPAVQVGFDGDILTVTPSSLLNWGKLQLEPLSGSRDVEYLVVAPDIMLIIDNINLFMKELSQVYEDYHFGKHSAVAGPRHGVMRIGKKLFQVVADELPDAWFSTLGNSSVSQQLQLWAKAFRGQLVPLISNYMSDKQVSSQGNSQRVDKSSNRPTLVVYFVDAFGLLAGAEGQPLPVPSWEYTLRLFYEVTSALPSSHQWNMQFQVIPVGAFLDPCWHTEGSHVHRGCDLHQLALQVYSQCRTAGNQRSLGKSLTNFGMSAGRRMDMISMETDGISAPRLYTPAFTLSHESPSLSLSGVDDDGQSAGWLFCSYSWSSDSNRLVCILTDGQGHVLEPTVLSLTNRNGTNSRLQCSYSAFRDLLSFCVDFVWSACRAWHLVFTCTGDSTREDKEAWKKLLTAERLHSVNEQLASNSMAGNLVASQSYSTILSAAVVSVDPNTSLRVVSTQGENSSASLLVLPSEADARVVSKTSSQEKKDDEGGTSTFTELTSETIVTSSGSGLEDLPFSVNAVDGTDSFVILPDIQAGGSPLLSCGTGLPSVDSELLPFVNSSHPSSASVQAGYQHLGSLTAETPTSDLGSMLLGSGQSDRSSMQGETCGQKTDSSVAVAYLFESGPKVNQRKDGSSDSVLKASLMVYCGLTTKSCQQHLRSIMCRLDALSWLSLDLTTGQRLSFMPFHQSAVTVLSHQVDRLSKLASMR